MKDVVALSFACGTYYTVVLDIVPVLECTECCDDPDRQTRNIRLTGTCCSLFYNFRLFVSRTNSDR